MSPPRRSGSRKDSIQHLYTQTSSCDTPKLSRSASLPFPKLFIEFLGSTFRPHSRGNSREQVCVDACVTNRIFSRRNQASNGRNRNSSVTKLIFRMAGVGGWNFGCHRAATDIRGNGFRSQSFDCSPSPRPGENARSGVVELIFGDGGRYNAILPTLRTGINRFPVCLFDNVPSVRLDQRFGKKMGE